MKFSFIFDYMDYIDNIFEKKLIDDIEIYEQFEKNFIKEGLITSQPLDKTVRILKNRFNVKVEVMDDNEIVLSELEQPLDFYLPIINNLGYFISLKSSNGKWYNYTDEVNGKIDSINIEAKYDEVIEDIPRYIYHTTLTKNDDKIQRIGLLPRTHSKLSTHPDRIYFTKDLDVAHKFGSYLQDFDDMGYGEYTIWKIDTKDLNLKLYSDVNFRGHGFYTLHNIPASNLSTEYISY